MTTQDFLLIGLGLFAILIIALAWAQAWHDKNYRRISAKRVHECKPAAFIMTDWKP